MTSSLSRKQATSIFDEVRTRFLAPLPPNHKLRVLECSSPAALLRDVEQLDVICQNRQRGGRFLSGLKKLVDNLTPFFRVIDLVVNSHPEYASIVWGALNLVMQLASNFTAFFVKLNKTLDRITKAFPAYFEIEKIIKTSRLSLSDQVKVSLGRIYENLLSFLFDVVNVFSRPDGRNRSAPTVITSLAFKSFEFRFDDILSSLKDDQKLLELEVDILNLSLTESSNVQIREDLANAKIVGDAHAKAIEDKVMTITSLTLEAKASLEVACKEITLQNIRRWISVPNFASDFEECLRHREANTCNWIFDDPLYRRWCDEPPTNSCVDIDPNTLGPSTLWIYGSPGTGKSVLTATVVDDLLDQWSDDDDGTLVLYYFFKYTGDQTGATAAYRGMLGQILHRFQHDITLVNKFSFAMLETSKGQTTATENELLDLLKLCFHYFRDVFVVLDGIDECSNSERLLSDLGSLGCGQKYRILLSGRISDASLLTRVPESRRIAMSNSGVVSDIQLYAHRHLEAMVNQSKFPASVTLDDMVKQVVKGSGYMFLWTRLIIIYLKSPALTPKRRLSTMSDITHPEGLDHMYMRILELIAQGPEPELKLAMAILNWLARARCDITETELKEAMRIEIGCDKDDDFDDFRTSAVIVCCGLVESTMVSPSTTDADRQIHYIHLSARDFIRKLNHTKDEVPSKLQSHFHTESEMNLRMAEVCLSYINNNLTGPPSCDARAEIDGLSLGNQFPFAVYCSSHWIDHLSAVGAALFEQKAMGTRSGGQIKGAFEALDTFLSRPFVIMAWVEASYCCHRSSKQGVICAHEERINKLTQWCEIVVANGPTTSNNGKHTVEVIANCFDLCRDLSMLHQMLGNALRKSPQLIWNEAPAFAPSKFWVASASTVVTMLRPDEFVSAPHGLSGKPLLTISESLLGECLVGVLSIWPSRKFETYWASVKNMVHLRRLYERCNGWAARYQVWWLGAAPHLDSTSPPTKRIDSSIELSQTAVWTAIHQSLRKENSGNWRFHFPVAIRQDLTAFTILQTVFQASKVDEKEGTIDINFQNLVLEDLLGLNHSWWNLKRRPPGPHQIVIRGGPRESGMYYDYKLTFSPNGHMLYFRDSSQGQDSTLAVIALDEAGAPRVLQKCRTGREWDEDIITFHPWAPLLFIFRSRVIKVWNISGRVPTAPELFYNPNCGYQDGLKEMQISSCGRYIIMIFPRRKPVIQTIEHLMNPQHNKEQYSAILPQQKHEVRPGALFRPGQVMKGMDLMIADNGAYRSLSVQ